MCLHTLCPVSSSEYVYISLRVPVFHILRSLSYECSDTLPLPVSASSATVASICYFLSRAASATVVSRSIRSCSSRLCKMRRVSITFFLPVLLRSWRNNRRSESCSDLEIFVLVGNRYTRYLYPEHFSLALKPCESATSFSISNLDTFSTTSELFFNGANSLFHRWNAARSIFCLFPPRLVWCVLSIIAGSNLATVSKVSLACRRTFLLIPRFTLFLSLVSQNCTLLSISIARDGGLMRRQILSIILPEILHFCCTICLRYMLSNYLSIFSISSISFA